MITAQKKMRKIRFSLGVLPGSSRFFPSAESDQFRCFPEPFTPAKGFSWNRQVSPLRFATLRITSMVSWLWSQAIFDVL